MSLVVLTGPVRSGKSTSAEELAASRGKPVVVAVAARAEDPEMQRRIEAHQARRPRGFEVIEVTPDAGWVADVPEASVLLVECVGTLVGAIVAGEVVGGSVAAAEEEAAVRERTSALVDALAARAGDTVVVTNEVGWGVVPAYAAGRVFRDAMGWANQRLVEAADAAYLAVAGRYLDLRELPATPSWPEGE
jgi:adenosylcobinamide kinase / adenosylcobinamide-phosphate guanylyltransferase